MRAKDFIIDDMINRNVDRKQWQVRRDTDLSLRFETPSTVLKDVTVAIDHDAFNTKKVFAYLKGDRTELPDLAGYESFPIQFRRDLDEPFYRADTGATITNCDYVVFGVDGKVTGYSQALKEDAEPDLEQALENWMEMYSSPQDIQTILTSPVAEPFKKAPRIQKLYRAIVPGDREINSIKSSNNVMAFATTIDGAITFIESLDTQDDWIIIEKRFNPADFLLDFTGLYEYVTQPERGSRYMSEHEVWMKPTAYYAGVNENEIVHTSQEYYGDN